jgi:hypothetical protein
MRGGLSNWLPLWIVAPLALLVLILAVAFQMPDNDCGEGSGGGTTEAILAVLVFVSTLAVIGAALYRLGTMTLNRQYGKRDAVVVAATALVVLATWAVRAGENSFVEAVLIATFIITSLALLALTVAAATRRDVEAVGVLVPIYLFGAAYVYLAAGILGILVSSGIGC